MREGGLDAPVRHPLAWHDPDFADEQKIDAEMRRVFDICHGCRRCFNLCDSFPTLFDLIDDSQSGELDTVASADFAKVVDGCTLCDMCFMVSCPYVPPHEFNLDFPHLMLRYRAAELKKGKGGGLAADTEDGFCPLLGLRPRILLAEISLLAFQQGERRRIPGQVEDFTDRFLQGRPRL